MRREIRVFDSGAELVETLANVCQHWVDEAVAARGIAHLVLAGGRTPVGLYRELRSRALPWASLEVYFGDERCVPADDPESNYRAAREALLGHVSIPSGQIHRMHGEEGKLGAEAYGHCLPERFDITFLGMGEDGHTASLFPNSRALQSDQRVVFVDNSPKPPAERITLGLSALNASRRAVFMVTGSSKADALARVGKEGSILPASRVAPTDGTVSFFVDREAAANLPRRES
ncbi:MAG: 6-phosphogluconolactonase [Myxococcota bacterium]